MQLPILLFETVLKVKLILNCQNQCYTGNCKASLANLHAVHRDNGAAATANANKKRKRYSSSLKKVC